MNNALPLKNGGVSLHQTNTKDRASKGLSFGTNIKVWNHSEAELPYGDKSKADKWQLTLPHLLQEMLTCCYNATMSWCPCPHRATNRCHFAPYSCHREGRGGGGRGREEGVILHMLMYTQGSYLFPQNWTCSHLFRRSSVWSLGVWNRSLQSTHSQQELCYWQSGRDNR